MALLAASAAALLFSAGVRAEPATSSFVYTADENGNTVSRIDLASGMVEIVPVGIAPHNVQFVPTRNLILATGTPVEEAPRGQKGGGQGEHGHRDFGTGKLILLQAGDIAAGVEATITVGEHPAHVVANAEGSRAYVTNAGDDTVTVIDIEKRKVIATVETGDRPHGLRISPDGKSIYVANVADGTVSVIDTNLLVETTRIAVGSAPVQVGFLPDGSRVYVSLRDENKVAVIDTASRKVVARIDVGRSPIQVHATPDGRFVYVANQGTEADPDDTVSVIEVATGSVVEPIRTRPGAHGVAVSDDGDFVFVSNIAAGTVSEISVGSQSVVRTYDVGKGPNGITFEGGRAARQLSQ